MSAGAKFFECGTGASLPCAFIPNVMSSKHVVPIHKYGLRVVAPKVSHLQSRNTMVFDNDRVSSGIRNLIHHAISSFFRHQFIPTIHKQNKNVCLMLIVQISKPVLKVWRV